MNRSAPRRLAPMLGSAIALTLAFGALARGADDEATVKAWLEVCKHYSGQFTVVPAKEDGAAYERLPQPVFRHAQPARGNDVGAVWLWVDPLGRPVVIGDTFTWSVNRTDRHVTQEFHSLVDIALEVRLDGRVRWSPRAQAIGWRPVPDAPVAADSKAGRTREARAIARRFSGHTTDAMGGRWELRTIPQPVHQYDLSEKADRQAGALFALCQGTDPEVWLALECRQVADGARWHYACAAFTDYEVRVLLDDKEVWQQGRFDHANHRNDEPHWIETISDSVELPAPAAGESKPAPDAKTVPLGR